MSFSGAKFMDRVGGGVVHKLLLPWRALRRPGKPLETIREIVVVKFWGIGNAALLLPVLRSLRRRYPGARLTMVTLQGNEAVYARAADRILTVRAHRMGAAILDLVRITRRLRRDRIDLALDMEQFVRTSQVLLFLARARQVIAFDTPGLHRAALANVRVPYDDHKHMAEGFLDLARAAGVPDARYRPGGLEPRVASPLVPDERPLAVLHHGSGDHFPGRRWPPRRFGLLARNLVEAGARVALTGSGEESELARQVREAAGVPLEDLTGRIDLDQLVALLSEARVLVSNDTGPVHLAAGVGTSVVALYGPNTPRLYGPLSPGSRAFYRPPPCSPCITNFNYKTSGCLNPVCIRALEVDEVAAAVRARLHAVQAEKRA
ncbi:MAG: glycosyltransferase family 9 protein [Planctomycetota bacterium]|jgi:ADP-heptose:LPS heptosyltransferase